MSQSLRARATLRLAHDIDRPVRHQPRPVPVRIAVVMVACLIVPVLVVMAEMVRGAAKGWFA